VDEKEEVNLEFEKKDTKKTLEISEDYYEILGLSQKRWNATDEELKQAYKKLVLNYHPDKNDGIEEALFQKINKAYETLKDPKKKEELMIQKTILMILFQQ